MTDRTPTTAHVRDAYVRQLRDTYPGSTRHGDDFDSWLRGVQANAWAFGYLRGIRDELTDVTHGADNPYEIDGPNSEQGTDD